MWTELIAFHQSELTFAHLWRRVQLVGPKIFLDCDRQPYCEPGFSRKRAQEIARIADRELRGRSAIA